MHHVIGSYNHETGIGTACRASSVPKRYAPSRGGNPFHPSLEDGYDVMRGDVINFVNMCRDKAPAPNTIWKLTHDKHSFVERGGDIYYTSAQLDENSRFISTN